MAAFIIVSMDAVNKKGFEDAVQIKLFYFYQLIFCSYL